jgi:hypothetical protein
MIARPLSVTIATDAASHQEDQGAVSISVDITQIAATCVVDCAFEQPSDLPVTGADVVSLLVPLALVVVGIAATLWSRCTSQGRRPVAGLRY